VKKLYDTPLGAVYRINPSPYFSELHGTGAYFDNTTINSLQCQLTSISNKSKSVPRFIVIDFCLRLFPALEKAANPNLFFSVTRSSLSEKQINKVLDLNGVAHFAENQIICWYPIPTPGQSKYQTEQGSNHSLELPLGIAYIPYYEPVSCRLLLSSTTGVKASCNVNGTWKNIQTNVEEYTDHNPFQSFGIMIMAQDGAILRIGPKKMKHPEKANVNSARILLEISPFTVRTANDVETLRNLPPVQRIQYPYAGYWNHSSVTTFTSKNPDVTYAQALRRLETGEELPEAVSLLKDAAKHNHVLAMYQLGLCYYRGLGVEPDIDEAVFWMKKAAEYNLPEGAAWYGLMQIRKPLLMPFITAQGQERLKYMLNHFGRCYGKHENWLAAQMFFNDYGENPYHDYATTPKLELWAIANNLNSIYYRNNIITGQDRQVRDSRLTATVTSQNNHFREVRLLPLVIDKNFRAGSLERLVFEDHFAPAMLYRGRLILALLTFRPNSLALSPTTLGQDVLTQEKAFAEALRMFQTGASLGNDECKLESWFCLAQMGKLQIQDFTAATDLQLGDYPLYHILGYAVAHPQSPGIQAFLERKYSEARRIWREHPSPWNHFLLGAETLYQFFDYGWNSAYYRVYWGDIDELTEAFKQLDQAATAGIVPAQYLTGMQYLNKQRCPDGYTNAMRTKNSWLLPGLKLLNMAADAGSIKARYQIIRYEFQSRSSIDRNWLQKLQPARDVDYGGAWFLTAEILARMAGRQGDKQAEVMRAYQKAAELGTPRAWYCLGMLYYQRGDKKQAATCWAKFIHQDRKERCQDMHDLYFDHFKPLSWNIRTHLSEANSSVTIKQIENFETY